MSTNHKASEPTREEAVGSLLNRNRIYVVASYRQHFVNWCEENTVPHNHPNVKHVHTKEDLMGITKVPLFLAYGWWKDKNLERAVFDYCSINGIYPETLPRALVISIIPS